MLFRSQWDSAFYQVIAQPMPEREPFDLPIELREFLQRGDFACLTIPTDQGTAYILRAPGFEIDRCRGTLPISLHHQLFLYPTAPVIRTVIGIHDQADSTLLFESFINVADPDQKSEFSSLSQQTEILLLFYDEQITCRLTKMVRNSPSVLIPALIRRAESYYHALPDGRFDFDVAKAKLMRDHPLTNYGATT